MPMIEDNTHIHTHTHTKYSGGSSGWRVEREVSDLWCKSQARYAEMQVATWSHNLHTCAAIGCGWISPGRTTPFCCTCAQKLSQGRKGARKKRFLDKVFHIKQCGLAVTNVISMYMLPVLLGPFTSTVM